MIYVDTSVALAYLLGEEAGPGTDFWDQTLVSSRLLEVESWNRIHASSLAASHGPILEGLLGEFAWIELDRNVLARAGEAFPAPTRTLDALHLASALVLHERGLKLEIATFDEQMARCAKALGLKIYSLST